MVRRYAVLAVLVSVLLLGVGGYVYIGHVDGQRERAERESDQRWCELLRTLDEAYGAVPPSSELGRRVAAAIHDLRVDLSC